MPLSEIQRQSINGVRFYEYVKVVYGHVQLHFGNCRIKTNKKLIHWKFRLQCRMEEETESKFLRENKQIKNLISHSLREIKLSGFFQCKIHLEQS